MTMAIISSSDMSMPAGTDKPACCRFKFGKCRHLPKNKKAPCATAAARGPTQRTKAPVTGGSARSRGVCVCVWEAPSSGLSAL